MYTRIVVPLDGSDLAERALPTAVELATLMHAPLHLMRVIEFPDPGQDMVTASMLDTGAFFEEDLETARQYLQAVKSRLTVPGGVTHQVRHGAIAQQLTEAARSGDLYVMSSHGRTGISRWFMGSVAEEVMRRSTAPVLLVRATTTPVPESRMASQARLQPAS